MTNRGRSKPITQVQSHPHDSGLSFTDDKPNEKNIKPSAACSICQDLPPLGIGTGHFSNESGKQDKLWLDYFPGTGLGSTNDFEGKDIRGIFNGLYENRKAWEVYSLSLIHI